MPAARIYFTEDGRAIERAGHPYGYLKREAEQREAAINAKPKESNKERMKRRVAAYKASQGLTSEGRAGEDDTDDAEKPSDLAAAEVTLAAPGGVFGPVAAVLASARAIPDGRADGAARRAL
jgi:hypothetical protein